MRIKGVLFGSFLHAIGLSMACMCGLGLGALLSRGGGGEALVMIEYFDKGFIDYNEFNRLVSDYLRERELSLEVACFAVGRIGGVELVIIDRRNHFSNGVDIKQELVCFYIGYMSAKNKYLPTRRTQSIEWLKVS